jgi:hypothetical protein
MTKSTSTRRAKLSRATGKAGRNENRWHVIARKGGWVVSRETAQRATKTFDSQVAAIDHARSLARNSRGELVVHHRDGTMQSYQTVSKRTGHFREVYRHVGDDPQPPKDDKGSTSMRSG